MILNLDEGTTVYVVEKPYRLQKLLDHDRVLAVDIETQEPKVLKIAHLSSSPVSTQVDTIADVSEIPEHQLEEAERKLEAIKPILNSSSRKEIEARANEVGVSYVTVYAWLKKYRSTGLLTSLVRRTGRGGPNKSRLLPAQDEIINSVIEEFYLTSLKPNTKKTHERIASYCHNAQLSIPSVDTIQRRLNKISQRKTALKREGKNVMRQYLPLEHGGFPDYVKPMHTIQIDHTPVDIMLVDDIYRTELGRPYITLAIDVYSRMITGYYISFEAPSYMSTAMSIISSVLPKDEIVKKHNLASKWPVYGIPQFIHLDNAAEFRGENLKRVCKDYGINLIWRPVGRAYFGGHIERLISTLNEDIHILEGTTFSDIKQKGEYNSQKESIMTLSDFEEWLAVLIVDKYHNTVHSGIGMTPLQKYNEGIFGTDTQPPKGLPPIIEDKFRFRVNMLPNEERTIQRDGVSIDGIKYYHPIIETFIKQVDSNNKNKKQKFSFRLDPRDISKIYFYNPEEKEYYEIPYHNTSFPAVSIWEWRAAKKYLKNQESRQYNETEIFNAINRLRTIALKASSKTKTHRRLLQRQSKNNKPMLSVEEAENLNKSKAINTDYYNEFDEDNPYDSIEPFEGIED